MLKILEIPISQDFREGGERVALVMADEQQPDEVSRQDKPVVSLNMPGKQGDQLGEAFGSEQFSECARSEAEASTIDEIQFSGGFPC